MFQKIVYTFTFYKTVITIQPMLKLSIKTIHNYICFISRDISSGEKKKPTHVAISGQNLLDLSQACLHSQRHLTFRLLP